MKLFPKKNEEKTTKISLGTMYDINKDLVSKINDLTKEELEEKKNLVIEFLENTDNHYYMLLCNERKDYTIFHRGRGTEALQDILLDECIPNRGRAKAIDITQDKSAIEIWLSIDDEMFCYYFFPYDLGIIEC